MELTEELLMEFLEKLDFLRWNPHWNYLHAAVSIDRSPDRVNRADGPPWKESRLKPRTAAMDRMGICKRCCHNSF
jgi:hypothetical protein